MKVTVAYALPARQWSVEVELDEAATAGDALAASGLLQTVPGLAVAPPALAVFGRPVAADRRLREGDRVELLRPLLVDPKEVRRRLAAEGRVMGRKRPDQD